VNSAAARPSPNLWTAAVAGLMSAVACGVASTDDHHHDADTDAASADTDPTETDDTEPADPILSTESRPDLTFQQMSDECEAAGGLMQTHATCAGNNACRGMSFNKWSKDYTEHTCRGLNSCGGASCVVLQEDQNRPVEELYDDYCGGMCHGADFTVFAPPDADLDAALAAYEARSTFTHLNMIAFGLKGMNASGTPYANMPAFYEKFSRAELERLAAYVKTLPATAAHFQVSGETEDFTEAQ
jgi:hypothetical protein